MMTAYRHRGRPPTANASSERPGRPGRGHAELCAGLVVLSSVAAGVAGCGGGSTDAAAVDAGDLSPDAAADSRSGDVADPRVGDATSGPDGGALSDGGARADAPEAAVEGGEDGGDATVDSDAQHVGDAARDATLDASNEAGDGAPTDADAGSDAADCSAVGANGEALDLRCAGLYGDWATKTVAADARPYDPGLRLWSDGATKNRWVQLPAGAKIDTSKMDDWVFPNGTKFWKEFILGGKRIETRLIWKSDQATWYATTYRWAADESSAIELTGGEVKPDGYEIPGQFACPACHEGRPDFVLGFEAVSLSSPAASGVTMASLIAEGRLTAPPASPITVPGTPAEAAALGYLHANCGTTCHNPESPANNKGLFMRLSVKQLGSVAATDTWKTAWNVPTVGFPGPAGTPTRIAACDAGGSAVYYRMSRRDGFDDAGTNTQMPPADTHKVDDAGIAIIGAWIDENCRDAGARDAR